MDGAGIALGVAAIWTVAVVTPGPNFFLTAQLAAGRSRRHALWAVLGIASGTVVWALAGYLGLNALFAAAPWLFLGLKLLGGAYLVYLGGRLILASPRSAALAHPAAAPSMTAATAWRRGLLTNLSNPKTAAFVTSLFAATLPADPPLWLGLTAIGLMAAISLVWYGAVACVLGAPGLTTLYARARRWLERLAGAVFVAFGLRLAWDQGAAG